MNKTVFVLVLLALFAILVHTSSRTCPYNPALGTQEVCSTPPVTCHFSCSMACKCPLDSIDMFSVVVPDFTYCMNFATTVQSLLELSKSKQKQYYEQVNQQCVSCLCPQSSQHLSTITIKSIHSTISNNKHHPKCPQLNPNNDGSTYENALLEDIDPESDYLFE